MSWLARLTLIAYPKDFRQQFGPDYLQAVADLHTHGQRNHIHIASRVLADAVTTAPTMRWENLMNSHKLIITAIAVVAITGGLFLAGPIVALPLAVVAALVISARRHDRPIATEAATWGQRWYAWLAVAAGLFAIGAAMLFTADDGDLNTAAWAVWILSWLSGAVVAVAGLGLGATRIAQQRRA